VITITPTPWQTMLARSWERPKPDGMGRGPQDFYREQRRRRKKHRGGARGRIAPANFFFARYSAKRPEIREPKRPPPLPPHLRDGASQRAADQYGPDGGRAPVRGPDGCCASRPRGPDARGHPRPIPLGDAAGLAEGPS
jgi:hypothetical protein